MGTVSFSVAAFGPELDFAVETNVMTLLPGVAAALPAVLTEGFVSPAECPDSRHCLLLPTSM